MKALRPQPPEHWSYRKQLAHYEGRIPMRFSTRMQSTAAACVAIFTLLALLMLTGCYSYEVHVRPCDANADSCGGLDNLTAESNDALWEAQEILGYPIVVTSDPVGAVTLILVSAEGDRKWGRSIGVGRPCVKVAHTVRNGTTIAHELGHALGLRHPCTSYADCKAKGAEKRLMTPGGYGLELTEAETETMERGMRRLELCRGD
jgi:hypothetical protein